MKKNAREQKSKDGNLNYYQLDYLVLTICKTLVCNFFIHVLCNLSYAAKYIPWTSFHVGVNIILMPMYPRSKYILVQMQHTLFDHYSTAEHPNKWWFCDIT